MEVCDRKGRSSPAALKFCLQGYPVEGLRGLPLGIPSGGRGGGRRGVGSGYRRTGVGVW